LNVFGSTSTETKRVWHIIFGFCAPSYFNAIPGAEHEQSPSEHPDG
jgi:hypothetical protein